MAKWGLRVYVIADCDTNYICNFEPYYGKETTDALLRPDLPFTQRIVLQLCQGVLDYAHGDGFHVFTDRFYTGYNLAMELYALKMHLTGTIQKNRINFPDQLKKKVKMKKFEVIAYAKGNKAMTLMWQDKRQVAMLSTYHTNDTQIVHRHRANVVEEVTKPTVIMDYTSKMGAVDHADQMCGSYNFCRKSFKWWRKLFFWLVEVAVVNSYILQNISKRQAGEREMTHLDYRRRLIVELVGTVRQKQRRLGRPSTKDLAERMSCKPHFIAQHKIQRDCAVCSDPKIPGGRKRTVFFCKTCTRNPGLHPGECFERYHTLNDYRTE